MLKIVIQILDFFFKLLALIEMFEECENWNLQKKIKNTYSICTFLSAYIKYLFIDLLNVVFQMNTVDPYNSPGPYGT